MMELTEQELVLFQVHRLRYSEKIDPWYLKVNPTKLKCAGVGILVKYLFAN